MTAIRQGPQFNLQNGYAREALRKLTGVSYFVLIAGVGK
jgi:hypothetical protein